MKRFFNLLLFAAVFSSGLAAQDITAGLKLHYQFEDNLTDAVSNETSEAVGILSYAEGIIGRGVRYFTDDAYFLTPEMAIRPGLAADGGTPISFALFVKHREGPLGMDRQNYLQQLDGCDATGRATLYMQSPGSGTNPDSIISFVGNATSKSGIGLLVADEWAHLALTIDPESRVFTFYLNGVMTNQDTLPGAKQVEASCGSYIVGHHKGLENHSITFDGIMDDLRFYDRVITPDEVAAIAALGGIVSTRPALVQGGMKLYPNPVTSGQAIQLDIDNDVFTPGDAVRVRVSDAMGRIVMNREYSNTPSRITLDQQLHAGTYTVFLSNGSHSTSLPVLVR